MNANLPWEVQLVLAAVAGLIIGLLIMWLLTRKGGANHKAHEALQQQFDSYRHQVDQHFADTATAVDELNRSYQKVVQHLSNGAQNLMGKEALQAQLAQRSNKTVTVAYLAAAAVEPLAQETDMQAAIQAAAATQETILPADKEITPPQMDPEEQIPVSEVPVIDAPHTISSDDAENTVETAAEQTPKA